MRAAIRVVHVSARRERRRERGRHDAAAHRRDAREKLFFNVSNYRSVKDLSRYLEEQGVIGISDIDTREITRRLRETGCLNGVLTTDAALSDEELVARAKAYDIVGKDLIR